VSFSAGDRYAILAMSRGRPDIAYKWWFGWEPLPKQFVMSVAPQHRQVILGSIRSGKTLGTMYKEAAKAAVIPDYRFLNCSISSDQAALMFKNLCGVIAQNARFKALVDGDPIKKPYPTIRFKYGGSMEFRSVGYQADLLRGFEWDTINFDEGGYCEDEFTIRTLEGRTIGVRETGYPREGKLCITTSPTAAEWLREMVERGVPPNGRYLTMVMTIFENHHLPQAEVDAIVDDYPEELVEQELYARLPDFSGGIFARQFVVGAENMELNDIIDNAESSGIVKEYHPQHGLHKLEIPPSPTGRFVLAGDPGTGNFPKRNAGTVTVFDVNRKPARLVYFDWTAGNGSIMPFLNSYKYAIERYRPEYRGFDATGPQKMLDELAFDAVGIDVDALNFQRDKSAYINSLQVALARHEIEWPFIKGLRNQLTGYREPDKHIAQDIVCSLGMSAYLMKRYTGIGEEQTTEYQAPPRRPVRRVRRASRRTQRAAM
jgi:hypothetical protein